jgi:transposase-like protein
MDMNESISSNLVPELHCPDCKKPMRVQTVLPTFNGLWDLSFECDQCGKVSGVVHKPEDR